MKRRVILVEYTQTSSFTLWFVRDLNHSRHFSLGRDVTSDSWTVFMVWFTTNGTRDDSYVLNFKYL